MKRLTALAACLLLLSLAACGQALEAPQAPGDQSVPEEEASPLPQEEPAETGPTENNHGETEPDQAERTIPSGLNREEEAIHRFGWGAVDEELPFLYGDNFIPAEFVHVWLCDWDQDGEPAFIISYRYYNNTSVRTSEILRLEDGMLVSTGQGFFGDLPVDEEDRLPLWQTPDGRRVVAYNINVHAGGDYAILLELDVDSLESRAVLAVAVAPLITQYYARQGSPVVDRGTLLGAEEDEELTEEAYNALMQAYWDSLTPLGWVQAIDGAGYSFPYSMEPEELDAVAADICRAYREFLAESGHGQAGG